METRRFDELTVALARGDSRRGVLRGLAGGVLSALALERSSALAKNEDKVKDKDGITILAKPVCDETTVAEDCPLCYEAKYGLDGCCDPNRGEQYCGTTAYGHSCAQPNLDNCSSSCVTATCTEPSDKQPEYGLRCAYTKKSGSCTTQGATFCCARFSSPNFGSCVKSKAQC
jgi:hypothetical protein